MQIKIVEYIHNCQAIYTVNGVLTDTKILERDKYYQLSDNSQLVLSDFEQWCVGKGGEYVWDDTYKTNEGTLPEGYDCWCKCMEAFLLESGYVITSTSTNNRTNFHTYVHKDFLLDYREPSIIKFLLHKLKKGLF